MYENFLFTYSDKKSAMPQQLYKPASRGLSAIAELLVVISPVDQRRNNISPTYRQNTE